jgi:hypothetical protein
VVTLFQPEIVDAYTALLVWSLVRLVRAKKSTVFALRDWFGVSGLLAGICSATLLSCFFIYYRVEDRVLFSGYVYPDFVYHVTGSCLAIVGLLLASLGRGWVRRAGVFASLVAALQWLRLWSVVNVGLNKWVTIATFLSLLAWGLTSLLSQLFTLGSSASSIVQQLE